MQAAALKPNPKHDHVYAIVRVDDAAAPDVPLEVRITVKKIVADANVATAEVTRLNGLNAGKGCHYFAQITRLEKGILEPAIMAETVNDAVAVAGK